MATVEKFNWHIEGGMHEGRRLDVPIHVSPFCIGRDKSCHLAVTAPGISRKHLQIEVDCNTIYVSDLGSTNGTFVNRNLVQGRVELKSGDTIHLGNEELRIVRHLDDCDTRSFVVETFVDRTVMININDPEFDLKSDFVQQEKEFNTMLLNQELSVVFQPIVLLDGEAVIGYEALGRGAKAGLPTSPLGLFDIAEKLGKARELSSVFRTRAIKECTPLPAKSLIFVNTHPVENLTTGLRNGIEEMRKMTQPWQVVLEVHESAITNIKMMVELKAILRDSEMYLAYDDFGSGQARWNELVEAPPDYLKFDIALIRNIHKKPKQKQDMLRKLVEICLDQGSHPLAECVENTEELVVCKQLGFTHGQGWLFGKPATASSFISAGQ